MPDISPESGIVHFGFNVENFDEIIVKCEGFGVEILYDGVVNWEKSKSVCIVDPSGYELELWEVSCGGL